jgi:large subunit ribosomal protein L6
MSRVGKQPITVPKGVKVAINNVTGSGQNLKVEGPLGKLERALSQGVTAEMIDGTLVLKRASEDRNIRALHGMERALINNMMIGVSTGFSKQLELVGVGYRADMKGNVINLALGYSHPIDFPLPKGITGEVIKEGRDISVKITGMDKQLVGQVASEIRRLRKPEPYKGKGVKYSDEVIKRKAGKAGKK